jgi:primary-amine oxidase
VTVGAAVSNERSADTRSARVGHPLDPLTPEEFRASAALLRRDRGVTDRWRIASIELREPSKQEIKDHTAGGAVPREVLVVCWNRDDGRVYKATLSLTDDRVLTWSEVFGEQPNMTIDEFHEADETLRQHPDVIAGLAKRGITDMSKVLMDTWTYGHALIPEKYHGRRVGWTDTWYRTREGSNPYANPVNGFHCVLDLNSMELLEIEDTFTVDKPESMGEYAPDQVPGLQPREDLRALQITQPDGVSFTLDGNLLTWQGWSMRVGFNYREGLILHTVGYDDGGRTRPIAHRLSIAEMVVPYRDPTDDHYRRTAYDIGEWGLGFMTTSLELGCDCLGEIRYLDAHLHDTKGEPYTIRNAVCIHEEDNAVLWKHVDADTGAEVRRMRRLVVSMHATVANYEYLIYWRFYQDGNIECEVRATGIMVVSHFPEGQLPAYGTLVDQRTYAPYHQHFLVARLDMDVDGESNTVYMSESQPEPIGPDNPYGLALVQREVPLRTEQEGRQHYSWETQRAWKVVNDNRRNALGTPVGYKLVPGGAFPAMIDPASPVFRRAEAIGHTLWVTAYDQQERWPCGEFCNQSKQDKGLPMWTEQDRAIEDTDVVLWYVFGINHVTRPEEWPIMPVDTVSFWLKPFGFFDRNPALDVPASPRGAHECDTDHHH